MIRILHRLSARLRDWWAVGDPEERIEGSGEVVLDPAYNGRYTAERRLQTLANAPEDEEATGVSEEGPAHVDPPHLE